MSSACMDLFSRQEVSRISCFRRDQLRWLQQRATVRPSHSKGKCWYTREQLFGVLLIWELRKRGFTLETASHVWAQLQNRPPAGAPPWERGLPWLLTDGQTVHCIAEPNVVLSLLEQARNPAFLLISFAHIVKRIEEGTERILKPLPSRKPPRISAHEYFEQRQEQWEQRA